MDGKYCNTVTTVTNKLSTKSVKNGFWSLFCPESGDNIWLSPAFILPLHLENSINTLNNESKGTEEMGGNDLSDDRP